MSKVLGLEAAAATIRNLPHDANDDYPDVRRDERERIIAALASQAVLARPMSLEVALDFADNPRSYHSLAAPADTNGELYEALAVVAAAYRRAQLLPARRL